MPEKPTSVAGQRVAAFLIDSLIAFVLLALVWIVLTDRFDADTSTGGGIVIGDTRYAFSDDGARGAWGLFSLIDYLAIFVVLPGIKGWSPGRRLLKIRLVKADGSPPGVGRALLRWILLVVVDSFPYFIPYVTGLILMLTTRANQRVGDMAAGTYTVREQYAGQPVEPLLAAAQAPAGLAPAAPGSAPAAPAATPPGWYDDPHGQARLRWWDGSAWTDQTSG